MVEMKKIACLKESVVHKRSNKIGLESLGIFKMVIEDRRLSTAKKPMRRFHCHERLPGNCSVHDHISKYFIIIIKWQFLR